MGQTIGNYVVREKVETNETTTVFHAFQRSTNRQIRLHTLHPNLAQEDSWIDRFTGVGETAQALQHPNIAQVIEVGRQDGICFMAAELVDGITLKQMMQKDGPVPFEIAIVVLTEIARGLEAAHAHGATHRRISSDLISFMRNGTLKIVDFGVARPGDDGPVVLADDTVHDWLFYLAPEQISGGTIGPATDMYALGALTYELLAVRPFSGANPDAILRSILQEQPPSIDDLVTPLPIELAGMAHGLLSKDPTGRPTSTETRELLETLGGKFGLDHGQELLRELVQDPVRARARVVESRSSQEPSAETPETAPVPPTSVESASGSPEKIAAPGQETTATAPRTPISKPDPIAVHPEADSMRASTAAPAGRTKPIKRKFPRIRITIDPRLAGAVAFILVGILSLGLTRIIHGHDTEGDGKPNNGATAATPDSTGLVVPSPYRYLIRTSPPVAEISVDGIMAEHDRDQSAEVFLTPGVHTIRAFNKGIRVDQEFQYDVVVGDTSRTIILDLRRRELVTRKEW